MAVTANQLIVKQMGDRQSHPIATGIHIYSGTLVFLASGYATDVVNSGANQFAGVARDEVDNTDGSDGDLSAETDQQGVFQLTGTGFTQGTVGNDIYATDNFTVGTSSTNAVYVGRCVGYVSSTKILVKICVDNHPANVTAVDLDDDETANFGASDDLQILWSDGDADNHAAVIALGNDNQSLHITDVGAKATDWNIAATTHPNVYVHSNTTPATDYLRIGGHTGTAADIDVVGGTTLNLQIGGDTKMTVAANAVVIGDTSDTTGNSLTLCDGGADKPGYLVLYSGEATGVPYYLWVDSTGDLRIHTSAPTDEDGDGAVVGSQS